MFYYIGHGARPVNDRTTRYPQMCMGQNQAQRMIPLDWVYNQIKDKGARLSVVIGMCCNSEDASVMSKNSPGFSPNYGNTYMTDQEAARIQELCLNYKGNILVTSASPGQTSICTRSDLGVIDSYTTSLVYKFDELQKGAIAPSWDTLLASVKSDVNEVTEKSQTPIFETHVTKVSAPQQTAQKEAPKQEKTLKSQLLSKKKTPQMKAQKSSLHKNYSTRSPQSMIISQILASTRTTE